MSDTPPGTPSPSVRASGEPFLRDDLPIEKSSGGQCAHGVAGPHGCHKCAQGTPHDPAKYALGFPERFAKAAGKVIPVQGPPTLRDLLALPPGRIGRFWGEVNGEKVPLTLDAMREILDEQNREKARHALTEEQARKAIDEWRGKNPAWCVQRIRELEREVKSLQSQIIDLRLGLKRLQ